MTCTIQVCGVAWRHADVAADMDGCRLLSGMRSGVTPPKHEIHINKKSWEELIAYFPWYDMGHIENGAPSNSSIVTCVFATVVTFLPSRCLATIGGFLLSLCLGTIRGLLPSCCLVTIGGTHRHTDWLEGFFNWVVEMGSGAVRYTDSHTQTATWSYKPILFFQNKESRLKIFMNTVPASQKISITKTGWLMLVREIIAVHCVCMYFDTECSSSLPALRSWGVHLHGGPSPGTPRQSFTHTRSPQNRWKMGKKEGFSVYCHCFPLRY
jgi:hypothetical protein